MELHVRVCSARNLLDKQTFGKQDPYCKLILRGKSFKTRVHNNGDKTPVWNEVFVFNVVDPQLDQLIVEVKDKNFTSSTLIGECRLPVSMFLNGSVVDQWYTLNNGSKRAGEINLRVQFKGPNVQPRPSGPIASVEKNSKVAQAYPAPSYSTQSYPSAPSSYSNSSAYPSSTATAAVATSAQQYPSQYQQPPQQQYQQAPQQYQQPPQQSYQPHPYPQYSQPPPPQYAQPPPYQQPYYPPPPPPVYAYAPPPPATVAYAAGPPVMVVREQPYGYRHNHYRGGYDGDYGRGDYDRGGGMGQMAMGVGAGVLGGMLLGEAMDDIFD